MTDDDERPFLPLPTDPKVWEAAAELNERSSREQGIPAQVEDPEGLLRLARIIEGPTFEEEVTAIQASQAARKREEGTARKRKVEIMVDDEGGLHLTDGRTTAEVYTPWYIGSAESALTYLAGALAELLDKDR